MWEIETQEAARPELFFENCVFDTDGFRRSVLLVRSGLV